MKYVRPQNLTEATRLLASDHWLILSGGTDFFPGLQDRPVTCNVLDICALPELRGIHREEGYLRIGALVTWSDIVAADLPNAFDGLKFAASEVGSIQIQNRATLAGNICNASPAADGVPPLLTLNAEVELVSASARRRLALQDFIRGNRETALEPNELVSAILIPEQAMQGHSSFLKLGARKYLVISISMVAVRLVCNAQRQIVDAAISVGSCSLVALRLHQLEQSLIGQTAGAAVSELVSDEHISMLSPIDDVRSTKSYRVDASLELLRRVLADAGSVCR